MHPTGLKSTLTLPELTEVIDDTEDTAPIDQGSTNTCRNRKNVHR